MENKAGNKIKGVRIRTFNTFMIVLLCVLYVFLIVTTAIIPHKYSLLVKHTDEYIACEKDALMVTQASDYLTEQVRLYTQNMDIKYMLAYFEEANVTCRRENALEELEKHEASEAAREDLVAALQCSNDLMEREIYAMKLISVVNGYSDESLPEEVRGCQLKAVDAALSPEQMIEKARDLVFNEGYQDAKALIYSHLNHFTENITGITHTSQQESVDGLGRALFYQRIFISILFVINVITFAVVTLLIVKPLSIHIQHIKDNDVLQIVGSYEFKYLALTYNDIYELNAANKNMLTQKAEHDPLTGLLNRHAFDDLKMLLKESLRPVALVVLDADRFKLINDNYGHETGDLVLKRVAELLQSNFRSGDYVIRLGGDEFVVLMTELTRDNTEVIRWKFAKINAELQNLGDSLPSLTLSAGAAFSEGGFTDDLFAQADEALYRAKKNGRSRCCYYSDTDGEIDGAEPEKGDDEH